MGREEEEEDKVVAERWMGCFAEKKGKFFTLSFIRTIRVKSTVGWALFFLAAYFGECGGMRCCILQFCPLLCWPSPFFPPIFADSPIKAFPPP